MASSIFGNQGGNSILSTMNQLRQAAGGNMQAACNLLDRVLLHEVAHAMSMSHGLLDELHQAIPNESWVRAEEWSAKLVENHGVEAVVTASEVLGRPLCIGGFCVD